MKLGLLVVLVLIVSAFAASFLLADPGYVVIKFRGYLVEMSVPILMALFILTIIAAWMAMKLFRAPRKLGEAAGRAGHVGRWGRADFGDRGADRGARRR